MVLHCLFAQPGQRSSGATITNACQTSDFRRLWSVLAAQPLVGSLATVYDERISFDTLLVVFDTRTMR